MSITLHEQKNRIANYMKYIENLEDELLLFQAKRIGMDKKTFKDITKDDWWLTGRKAAKKNVIDRLVTVGCHQEFLTTYKKTVKEILKTVIYTYSHCPLISEPLNVEYANSSY